MLSPILLGRVACALALTRKTSADSGAPMTMYGGRRPIRVRVTVGHPAEHRLDPRRYDAARRHHAPDGGGRSQMLAQDEGYEGVEDPPQQPDREVGQRDENGPAIAQALVVGHGVSVPPAGALALVPSRTSVSRKGA